MITDIGLETTSISEIKVAAKSFFFLCESGQTDAAFKVVALFVTAAEREP